MKILFLILLLFPLASLASSHPLDEFFVKSEKEHEGLRTDMIIVKKNGKIVFERYDRGYNKDRKHLLWSIAKTLTGALYGVAHKDGLFQLEDSICKYRPVDRKDFCEIKIVDLLWWTSGIKWLEDYEKAPSPTYSSVMAMLYGEGHKDMFKFLSSLPIAEKPGTYWRYSSGDSVLLASLLPTIFKTNDIQKTVRDKLFNKLGMSITFESDPSGNIIGSSNAYTTGRSLANFGQLYANGGVWKSERLIEKSWVKRAGEQNPAFLKSTDLHEKGFVAGFQMWNNQLDKDRERPFPDGPEDLIHATGHWGQSLIVLPTQNIVIVRLGDNRDKLLFNRNRIVKQVLSMPEVQP